SSQRRESSTNQATLQILIDAMNHPQTLRPRLARRHRGQPSVMALCIGSQLLAGSALAAGVEPNGISVPPPTPPHLPPEESLQQFFNTLGEPIDAVAQASTEPSTFWPRCEDAFLIRLALSQSASPAGIAWYNVPASPTSAPTQVYPI